MQLWWDRADKWIDGNGRRHGLARCGAELDVEGRMRTMASKRLTKRQREVLEWIGQGCPENGWPDSYYKQSARMMEAYGLVRVSGHGPTWSARITSKGRDLLASGSDLVPGSSQADRRRRVAPVIEGSDDAVRQVPTVSGGESSETTQTPVKRVTDDDVRELYDLLVADEFHILAHLPADSPDIDWQARARRLAKAEDLLGPDRITIERHRVGPWNDLREVVSVALIPKDVWRTRTPQEVVDAGRVKYHPAVAAIVEGSRGFTAATLTRAKRVLHAMCTEAEARGWQVTVGDPERRSGIDYKAATSLYRPRRAVHIVTRAASYEIQAYEKHRRYETPPSREELEHKKRWGYYQRVYEYHPTGRLVIAGPYSVVAQDSESGRSTVENRLLKVFAAWAAQEPWAKRQNVLDQRRKAERARRRSVVEPVADLIHADNVRRDAMRERAKDYRGFLDVQTYVDALAQAQRDGRIEPGSPDDEWANWCVAHRADQDPLTQLHMPTIPAQNLQERERLIERLIKDMGPLPGDP